MTDTLPDTSEIIRKAFEPLCDETRKMVAPIEGVNWETHRLELTLDKHAKNFIAKVYKLNSWGEKLMPDARVRSFFQRIPERKKLNDVHTEWSIGATDTTALIINSVWPRTSIVMDSDAEVIYDSLLLRWLHQSIGARVRADYKLNGVLPDMPETYIENPAFPPNNYQRVAIATSINYESTALFMEQGTGKTPTCIYKIMAEAAHMRKNDPTGKSCYRVIIAVPKNIRTNWQREVQKFATLPGRVTILRGLRLDRIKQLCRALADDPKQDAMFTIVICSYECVRNSWEAIGMVPWDLSVCDESHMIKNPWGKRQKQMFRLRDISRRRAVLTGTPITNSLLDLYGQLEFLGEGFSGFNSFQKFRTFYGKYEKDEYTKRETFMGYQNLPLIQERLARNAFMISKKEALPFLPEKTYDSVETPMSSEQVEIYTKLQNQLMVEISNKIEKDGAAGKPLTMTVENVLTMMLRLAQITAGYYTPDEVLNPDTGEILSKREPKYFRSQPKLDQLVEDLKNEPKTTKTIVWTVFIPTIKAISARLTAEGIKHVVFYGGTKDEDRIEAERLFNNDDSMRVFVGNPAAGGCGLNLWGYNPDGATSEMNCDHVIRYSSNWSMVQRAQSEDRCHRIGTRKAVRYTDYTAPGSIDEEILARVQGHIATAATIQDVREIMRNVLEMIPEVSDASKDVEVDAEDTDDNTNED